MNESCSNCRFYFQHQQIGWCKRFPPTVVAIQIPESVVSDRMNWTTETEHPETSTIEWCGEWRSTTPEKNKILKRDLESALHLAIIESEKRDAVYGPTFKSAFTDRLILILRASALGETILVLDK